MYRVSDREACAKLDALLARLLPYIGAGPVADVLVSSSAEGWTRLNRKEMTLNFGAGSPAYALSQLWPELPDGRSDTVMWFSIGADAVRDRLPDDGWPDPDEWRLRDV